MEIKRQEDNSQCSYTTSEETFMKEVETVNQKCDNETVNQKCYNDYDTNTKKQSIELTQHQEEDMINEEKAKGKIESLSLTVLRIIINIFVYVN